MSMLTMDTTAVHNSLSSNNVLAASNSFRLMKGDTLNSLYHVLNPQLSGRAKFLINK